MVNFMSLHSPERQILSSLPSSHPLYGRALNTFSKEQLAEAASHALLPGLDRLRSHFDGSNAAHKELADLAGSVFRRVTRIIIQRTRITRLTDERQLTIEAQDDLLEATTIAFIHMAGALDALAIINGHLSNVTHYPSMGWQKKTFLDAIQGRSGSAAKLFRSGSAGNRFLHAVLQFRNTIHRRMPDTGTVGPAEGDPAHTRAILALESSGHQEILTSFEAVGWTGYVGIELIGGNFLTIQPATLIGLLMNDGIPLLNAVMDATPVEQLGDRRSIPAPDATLYPNQLRTYATRHLGLAHLST